MLFDICDLRFEIARREGGSGKTRASFVALYDWQPDESTAKLWVRNPGGAVWRKESRGASPPDSLSLVRKEASFDVSLASAVANASGVESQPPGSAGKTSRPATVKLLYTPPASAAHR